MTEARYDVLGIGNALVDVLSHTTDEFIVSEGLRKSITALIDTERAEQLYSRMGPGVEASGGAAANTLAGIASLGGRAAFIGRVADDQLGQVFRHDMQAVGVDFKTQAISGGLPTGRCLSLVTPDAERTMNTYLGVAAEMSVDDLDEEMIEAASITYLEGYLFNSADNKAAFYKAAEIAKKAGQQVALSLSDPFCVEFNREAFRELTEKYVDILFANQDEISSLYETDFASAMAIVRGKVSIACLTRGSQGSVIVRGDETVQVPAIWVDKVVDTTGAGDLYAAGFLYGYTKGLSLADCGKHAAIAAAEVISHMGARPLVKLSELVQRAA